MAAAAARGEEYVPAAGKKARKKTIAFSNRYQTDMESILTNNTDIRWQETIPLMKERYAKEDGSMPGDFPEDAHLKSKLTNCKTKLKQKNLKSML
ncbi:hypothetical protein SARC_00266 [Sphaeroforma arctica JP610]|uniref:Uncharacterized protein n=1 Tax=Sphaeroforma arctica JP610 TaxID=667725 RepID=A0A0L0GFM3_9EUKA|nr:hypothetical protein SARC_00266 [Sphaeroforma arctica JP610]KNC87636.1 hypothetical protein SARC_00266 [Sphaeroforma arctica JP610]|eukprot:XP_014161538.1 hypothetical protein SARC_00266 [Sphaeroforma arctica JP610]